MKHGGWWFGGVRRVLAGWPLAVAAGLLLAGVARAESAAVEAADAPGDHHGHAMSLENESQMEDNPLAVFVDARHDLIDGVNLDDPKLAEEALQHLSEATRMGFAPAARFAGSMLMAGDLMPRDVPRAMAWYKLAADLGDPDAQKALGDLYADGVDVAADPEQAARWYQAVLDNPQPTTEPERVWEIALRLGRMYAEGRGVPADPQKAVALWGRAAVEGHYPPAKAALAHAYARGLTGSPDVKAALKAYYEAADAYRTVGLRFDIPVEEARSAQREILEAMRALDDGSRWTKRLRKELARAGVLDS